MKVIQVVKNYGPIGGMEEYVFNLSKELAARETEVTVLCEKQITKSPRGIRVVELGKHRKPHWISHFRFSAAVDRWLREHPDENRITHSHERQNSHNLTTFHTTPFGAGKKKKLLHRASPRHLLYEYLEKRELMGPKTKAIVPVSDNLGKALLQKHPSMKPLLRGPIFPGVALEAEGNWTRPDVKEKGGTIGFIGREWERKGLPKVIEIWSELKKVRPALKLRVAGVPQGEISELLHQSNEGVEVLGWIDDKRSFYQSIDLLLHPAKQEAFGMIIAEAMTAQRPVLCSAECGAASLVTKEYGATLPAANGTEDWTNAAHRLLSNFTPAKNFSRTWKQVASEYRAIYEELLGATND